LGAILIPARRRQAPEVVDEDIGVEYALHCGAGGQAATSDWAVCSEAMSACHDPFSRSST
jgi:hypothetical protein